MSYSEVAYSPPDGFIAHGALRFFRFDSNGEPTLGGVDMGYTNNFALKAPEIEEKELPSYRNPASPGEIVQRVETGRDLACSFTTNSINKHILQLMYYAEIYDGSQSSGSASAEAVVAKLGKWVNTAFRDISSVVVKGSGGSPTYVANTDYQVDAWVGSIRAIPGGSIADDAALEVDYSYAALTWDEIRAGELTKIEGELRFEGRDIAGERDISLVIPYVKLKPSSDVSQIGLEYAEVGFDGELVKKAGSPIIIQRIFTG